MTRTMNARIAGPTLLLYIAAGGSSMVLFGWTSSGNGVAKKLAGMSNHPAQVGVVVLLGFVQCFAALVPAVTL